MTLFDSLFLPQGLALHRSMQREMNHFMLWVLCVDRVAYDTLSNLNLPNVRLLDLGALETPELLDVKTKRTKGEYCWTLTPYAPKFVFDEASDVDRVTYLDADLWFRSNTEAVFNEFEQSNKSVLITDHLFAAEHDHSSMNGRYCVQFMTFKREGSEEVRKWWEEKCIEWCYARFENGKFGDQKYLDEWPIIFSTKVHVLSDKYPLIGPWNSMRFPYSNAFAFHFHGVRLIDKNSLSIAEYYDIPEVTFRNVYRKYFEDLNAAIKTLEQVEFVVRSQYKKASLFNRILSVSRRVYWVIRVKFRRAEYSI